MYPGAPHGEATRVHQAVHALHASLNNSSGYQFSFSSHYAQAYMTQQSLPTPATLNTYLPATNSFCHPRNAHYRGHHHRHDLRDSTANGRAFTALRTGTNASSHWYEPGNHKCTHQQCSFIGSKKSVELHMMDRHLIFPSWWEKRKRKVEWDADPSLKNGKPIPIHGTNIVLDTPKAIDAWISERKKRFPTTTRVEDKKRKLQEAINRGCVFIDTHNLRRGKRVRQSHDTHDQIPRDKHSHDSMSEQPRPAIVHPLPEKPKDNTMPINHDSDSGSSSDMDPVRDAVSSKQNVSYGVSSNVSDGVASVTTGFKKPSKITRSAIRKDIRKDIPGTKVQQRQISNRPYLLRKLLLPEISMTVSNLSQAMHFLVENDFLQNVELNPGDAEGRSIEVLDETLDEST